MGTQKFASVLKEFSQLVGFEEFDALAKGAKLKIDDYVVSFIPGAGDDEDNLRVYVDLGPLVGDAAEGLRTLMELNFMLSAAGRLVVCTHPTTHNVFLIFRYALDQNASGQALLDTTLRSISELGYEVQTLAA
ncbi:CesT family type III secretion system chaperone [Xylophilus ampelinus]|uniref:Tir chaperone family protein CesT n=1 Tax=Xylophilus ampelinus TaxID=54067 RepID=A0A318SLF7_9BURK|nr:CesT family type III secretion system chaperone [Xylophilus ampelinus]MCS4510306.1 CesT family type III secretion system chaperone [Xylophilus ampelinus]PYE78071.1 Tir chaperone family protein CesT [Xylophilus ampelinus]